MRHYLSDWPMLFLSRMCIIARTPVNYTKKMSLWQGKRYWWNQVFLKVLNPCSLRI